jgi:hypothetical protein
MVPVSDLIAESVQALLQGLLLVLSQIVRAVVKQAPSPSLMDTMHCKIIEEIAHMFILW